MKKVSMVLLALLFSASMASAESFIVKAFNHGIDANNNQTVVTSYSRTFTDGKDPSFTANRINKDVRQNEIDNRAFGANATHFVIVDPDCVDCDGKFYDDVQIHAGNFGNVDATTDTLSTVGEVNNNDINNVALGANAFGSYKNVPEQTNLANIDTAGTATFKVTAQNEGLDLNGNQTTVVATAYTWTSYERLGTGATAVDYEGADVSSNAINNTAIGSNAGMDVEVNVDCECDGKFYTDVQVISDNYGDVVADTQTFSDVGQVNSNVIFTRATGAAASGNYTNFNYNLP